MAEYIARLEGENKTLERANKTLKGENKTLEGEKKTLSQLTEDSQPTTLNRFLENCHVYLSIPLQVRARRGPIPVLSSLTSPKGRNCPRRLKKWKHFDDSTREIFDRISAIYHPPSEPPPTPYSESLFTRRLGEFVQRNQITSEDDLRVHERTNMENMVTDIVNDIVQREDLRDDYDLGQGVAFENHTNNLSDGADEVRTKLFDLDQTDPMPKPTNADQLSVVKRRGGGDTVSFLIEYKSPYKLPKEVLREGIRDGMDLEQEIINRPAFSNDEVEKFRQQAEYAVAAVITQLYSYMLKAGIEYGYLSTGEIYLFLQIRRAEPQSLYYHFAEPNVDVNRNETLRYSAISQVLCFCLRASNSSRRNQQWRRDAKAQSLLWEENTDLILAQMTPLKPKAEGPSSAYKPARKLDLGSGEGSSRRESLRYSRGNASRVSCGDDAVQNLQDPETSSDEQDANAESPSARAMTRGSAATKAATHAHAARDNAGHGQQQQQQHHHLPYCTHKCLRGLLQRDRLDPQCPNRGLHPSTKRLRHTIDAPTLRDLLRNQLDTDMDHNCTPLDIQGARGALFKLTLASHGYTLVGKGTVRAFIPDLCHEGRVYERLRKLQGTCVPVCLGSLDCIYPYEYDIGVEIVHFLLLSWGGVALNWTEYFACTEKINQMEDQLKALGVEHEDERCLNVLQDETHGQLMLIDFERATVSQSDSAEAGKAKKGAKVPLREVSSNVPSKRGWDVDAPGDVINVN
ncbi:MAG: hypothetical protein Q9161_009755 [Pseudevernia consocians]